MLRGRMLKRLEQMLDEAIAGTFQESDYDESVLSRIECKWKQFLGASVLSRDALEREKNRVKELVSDISHQTKTPMANIRLYTELLKERLEESGDAENLKLLEETRRQTEKLEFLIRSLTKLSRLESNIVEVKPEKNRVKELLELAAEDIALKARKKEIELVSPPGDCGTAFFDMKWTKEALENVLDNAIKYSPCKSRIVITAVQYEMYTAVSVKDSGIGIKEEDTAKIFGRFYRAEEVRGEEGAGIGLYLTREILRRENGYVKVKSKPGKGAEFILYLQRNAI